MLHWRPLVVSGVSAPPCFDPLTDRYSTAGPPCPTHQWACVCTIAFNNSSSRGILDTSQVMPQQWESTVGFDIKNLDTKFGIKFWTETWRVFLKLSIFNKGSSCTAQTSAAACKDDTLKPERVTEGRGRYLSRKESKREERGRVPYWFPGRSFGFATRAWIPSCDCGNASHRSWDKRVMCLLKSWPWFSTRRISFMSSMTIINELFVWWINKFIGVNPSKCQSGRMISNLTTGGASWALAHAIPSVLPTRSRIFTR